MREESKRFVRFGSAIAIILLTLTYLGYTGTQQSKSYYVTIAELHSMGDSAYAKRLRVAGDVVPGSIRRQGTTVEFKLAENGNQLPVIYKGTEAPPDTFKDDSQALVEGNFSGDGVFHARGRQANSSSKYSPKKGGAPARPAPASSAPMQPLQGTS